MENHFNTLQRMKVYPTIKSVLFKRIKMEIFGLERQKELVYMTKESLLIIQLKITTQNLNGMKPMGIYGFMQVKKTE